MSLSLRFKRKVVRAFVLLILVFKTYPWMLQLTSQRCRETLFTWPWSRRCVVCRSCRRCRHVTLHAGGMDVSVWWSSLDTQKTMAYYTKCIWTGSVVQVQNHLWPQRWKPYLTFQFVHHDCCLWPVKKRIFKCSPCFILFSNCRSRFLASGLSLTNIFHELLNGFYRNC